MRLVLLLLLGSILVESHAQKGIEGKAKQILSKGITLYKIGKASSSSSELFFVRDSVNDQFGGFFSYRNAEGVHSVFYDTTKSRAIKKYHFSEEDLKVEISHVEDDVPLTDFEIGVLDVVEKSLFLAEIKYAFLNGFYGVSRPHLLITEENGLLEVFVVPGVFNHYLLPIGADYRIAFDEEHNVIESEIYHEQLVPITLNVPKEKYSAHQHGRKQKFITPTEICAMLLMRDRLNWDVHLVINKKYISRFNVKTLELEIYKNKGGVRLGD